MEQQILQSMLFPLQFQAAGASQSISDGLHESQVFVVIFLLGDF